MRRRILLASLVATATLASPAPSAVRGPYSVEILVGGVPLVEYSARGTTYIEATRNREYAVRLHNGGDARVAVALSVDGLGSIDARHTTAREARKWVLGPGESLVVEGWQVSADAARRFFFTTEGRSYGAWLGRTDNLGIVSAAFFGERRVPAWTGRCEKEPSGQAAESDTYAATGIGRDIAHRVRTVAFDANAVPDAVVEIRYEYRDALVRLGVIPWGARDPIGRRERARGFEDGAFAPDPFRRDR